MLAGQTPVIGAVAHGPEHLGSQYVAVAGITAERLAYYLLGLSTLIDIGCVEEVNTKLIGLMNGLNRIFLLHITTVCKPASQADLANL
ncbi:hypothetical protein D3C75_1285960 [compost metagenome]